MRLVREGLDSLLTEPLANVSARSAPNGQIASLADRFGRRMVDGAPGGALSTPPPIRRERLSYAVTLTA